MKNNCSHSLKIFFKSYSGSCVHIAKIKKNIGVGNDQFSHVLTWSSYKIHYSALYWVCKTFFLLYRLHVNTTYARKSLSSKVNFGNGWKFSNKGKIRWCIKAITSQNLSKSFQFVSFPFYEKTYTIQLYFSFGINYKTIVKIFYNDIKIPLKLFYLNKKKKYISCQISQQGGKWMITWIIPYIFLLIFYSLGDYLIYTLFIKLVIINKII